MWDRKWAFSYLFFLLFVRFSFFPDFSSKISPQPFKIETSNLVYRFTTTNCIMGLKMGLLLFVLPQIYSYFSPDFSSEISPQLFKIETSNLVYRFTTTSCNMGLKIGLLLFVLPYVCSFFFLSRFLVKDISTTVYDRNFKFGIEFATTSCIVRLQTGILLFVFLFLFLSL